MILKAGPLVSLLGAVSERTVIAQWSWDEVSSGIAIFCGCCTVKGVNAIRSNPGRRRTGATSRRERRRSVFLLFS